MIKINLGIINKIIINHNKTNKNIYQMEQILQKLKNIIAIINRFKIYSNNSKVIANHMQQNINKQIKNYLKNKYNRLKILIFRDLMVQKLNNN